VNPAADQPSPGDGRPADSDRPTGGPYPAGPPPVPPAPGTPPTTAARGRPPRARAIVIWIVTVLVIALLGAPLGLLWRVAAPSVPVVKTDAGAVLAQPEPEQFIAADGWFALLGVGLGGLVALAVWFGLRRYRGPAGAIAVTIGMIGAAILAWRLGREVGLAEYQQVAAAAPSGTNLQKPPDLRSGGVSWLAGVVPVSWGVLLAPAFGAAVIYTALAAWSTHPGLQVEPDGLSSGWPARPAPTEAPGPPGPHAGEPPRD
jgi:Protein of unknown function (DUF2567)